MIRAALTAAALVLSLPGVVLPTETTAPVPDACHLVASGADDGETVSGADFWSWRDAVSEDGELTYDGRVWSLDLWHGAGREVLGYSIQEDGDIWNTAACATPGTDQIGGTAK